MATVRATRSYKSFGLDFEAGRLYDVADADLPKYLAAWQQEGSRVVPLFGQVSDADAVAERAEAQAAANAPVESLAVSHLLGHSLETLIQLAKEYKVEYKGVKAEDLAKEIAAAADKQVAATDNHAA